MDFGLNLGGLGDLIGKTIQDSLGGTFTNSDTESQDDLVKKTKRPKKRPKPKTTTAKATTTTTPVPEDGDEDDSSGGVLNRDDIFGVAETILEEFYVSGVPDDTFDLNSELPMAPGDDADESTLPHEFDARTTWSRCPSIGKVVHQGKCGSW